MGELTARRVRNDFNNQLVAAIDNLAPQLGVEYIPGHPVKVSPSLDVVAAPENAAIRILAADGSPLKTHAPRAELRLPRPRDDHGQGLPRGDALGPAVRPPGTVRGAVFVQYGRRLSDLEATVRRVRLFLVFGVLAGTAAALAGGLILARRAMKPIAALTATSREIARTRDPSRRVPGRDADDEVAELARTLDEMLMALESSRAETSAMLDRQRQFVADASHELRTPLTSVLANLELLAEVLDGERGETARSALRSSQRMRRLVADLLLLARADAPRTAPREPVDLGRVLVEAAAELGPVTAEHRLSVDADASAGALCVDGTRDELHRLALNLMENAVKHTPAGTAIRASVRRDAGAVELVVEDEGPGVDPEACATACSSASSAAPATAAGRSASGCRSSAPSPTRTAARSRSRTRPRAPPAPASSCACRPPRPPPSGPRRPAPRRSRSRRRRVRAPRAGVSRAGRRAGRPAARSPWPRRRSSRSRSRRAPRRGSRRGLDRGALAPLVVGGDQLPHGAGGAHARDARLPARPVAGQERRGAVRRRRTSSSPARSCTSRRPARCVKSWLALAGPYWCQPSIAAVPGHVL